MDQNNQKMELLNQKVLNLEQEKEELLRKLFDKQMKVHEIKTVSFELGRLLNKIPHEDEIINDSLKSLNELKDMNIRVDNLLDGAKHSPISSQQGHFMESIIKELETMKELMDIRAEFYQKHFQKQQVFCNEQNLNLSKQLTEMQNTLNGFKKIYSELENVNFDASSIEVMQKLDLLKKSKPESDLDQIKNIGNIFSKYQTVKAQMTDVIYFQNRLASFIENIKNIHSSVEELVQKKDKLITILKEKAQTIAEESVAY